MKYKENNEIGLLIFRVFFAGLLLLELLNGLKIIGGSMDFTWLGLMVTGIFAWGASELGIIKFELKERKYFGSFLLAICVAVLLDSMGDMYHLYSRIDHYDKYLHFINGGLVTYMVYFTIKKNMYLSGLGQRFQGIIVMGIVSILGALYEVEEALEDVLIHRRQIRSGGNFDTAMDIMFNLLGSAIVVATIVYIYRKRKND